MNDENIYGIGEQTAPSAPVLDDIEYAAPSAKNEGPQGVAAPVLDDMDYVAPTAKKEGPQGVSAPVLDEITDYVPNSAKKGAPTNVTAPVLDDNAYTASPSGNNVPTEAEIIAGLTPEQREMYDKLPPEKQKQIIDMRIAQLQQQNAAAEPVKPPVLDDENSYTPPPKKETAPQASVTAPILDDENSYTAPPKKEAAPQAPVSAPILDDEPAPAKYVPKFVDEDLEKAKAEGAKRAVSSQLTSNQKDEKESLKMMLALKAEREAEAASKGFRLLVVLAFIGLVGAGLFYMFYSASFFGMSYTEEGSKFAQIMNEYSLYFAIGLGICGVLPVSGIGGLKSLTSFVYLILGVIQVFPGFLMISQMQGNMAVRVLLYLGALACTVIVFVTLSASENIGFFFKKDTKNYARD
ncbi:MAG: MFS transporter [Ruminococcus sp.]|nr:MFS transporter [Ruminococcus sp.]